MKIIYCVQGTYNSSGIERIVVGKANRLAARGHDVTIVTNDQNGRPDYFERVGVGRIDLDLMYCDTWKSNPLKQYFQRRKLLKQHKTKLMKIIEDLKPDVVISTFGYEKGFLAKFKDGSKKILEIHFSRWYRLQRKRKGIKRLVDKYLTWQDFKTAKKYPVFIALTEDDCHNWEGLPDVRVINNFIEHVTAAPAPLENKQMIAVGRLSYQKGYERMIDAWKLVNERHPDWKLNIFGGGELKKSIEERIERYGLRDAVRLHDPTPNIHEEYMRNSALLMTSRYEGFGLVLAEAIEAGLPAVSFDFKCGAREIIDDGVNGFIVGDEDINAFADAVCRLIENPELRRSMGDAAYKKAQKFYPEPVMKQWDSLLNEISEGR